jgi:hypothetical protein
MTGVMYTRRVTLVVGVAITCGDGSIPQETL